MHVVILGPALPRPMATHLDSEDREIAEAMTGSYGTAPSSIAASLLDCGHEVTVVTYEAGEGAIDLRGARCRFVRVDSTRSARSRVLGLWARERRDMVSVVRDVRPDVVHAHWTYEWAMAGLSSRAPLVITVRDSPFAVLRFMPRPYRVLRLMIAAWVATVARVRGVPLTAVSPYMARTWRRDFPWSRRPEVVPNPVPLDAALPSVRRSPRLTIVEVADASPRKNIRVLLRAFARAREVLDSGLGPSDVTLRLVGPGLGPDQEMARWAAAESVSEGVEFLGQQPRDVVGAALADAWIHVHAALEESFGNTLVEAMSAGTPIIAGRHSAAVPWVVEGAGILVDVRDPDRLSAAIVDLVRDQTLRDRLSAEGRRRATEVFSPRAVVEAYVDAYDRALDSAR